MTDQELNTLSTFETGYTESTAAVEDDAAVSGDAELTYAEAQAIDEAGDPDGIVGATFDAYSAARDAYCIFFDRASGDYAVCYDDKIIAYAPTYYHADRLVDTHIASHA